MSNFNVLDRVIGLLVEAYDDRFRSPESQRKAGENLKRKELEPQISSNQSRFNKSSQVLKRSERHGLDPQDRFSNQDVHTATTHNPYHHRGQGTGAGDNRTHVSMNWDSDSSQKQHHDKWRGENEAASKNLQGAERKITMAGASAAQDRARRLKAGSAASQQVNRNPLTRLGRAIAKNKLVRGIQKYTGIGPRSPSGITRFTNKRAGEKPMEEAFINKTISILVERRMNKSKKSSYKNKSC